MEQLNEHNNENDLNSLPICMIVLGMAGSGKSTFVQKLVEISSEKYKPYVINLDPACSNLQYHANIDIRDSVNYKEVMKQYKLGPNGGIVTALNLFSTKFGKVIELITKAGKNNAKYCIFDTPGQIEVFTWSASGTIITEALGTSFPTIIVYVMDIVRSTNPTTFMSNMLYACSILYKSRLPFIVVMNKIDVKEHTFAIEWMQDFDIFQEALDKEQTYVMNLTRTMSLTLDEFYKDLKVCGLSSKTGIGFSKFFDLIDICTKEYYEDYKAEYENLRSKKLKAEEDTNKQNLGNIAKGIGVEVPMNFMSKEPTQQKLSNIYLKHPENASSEDDEGNDEQIVSFGDDECEEINFNAFLKNKQDSQINRSMT